MEVMQNRLDRMFMAHQDEYEKKVLEVLRSGWYVLGKEVKAFESEFAKYIGTEYCVGVASGLDALWVAFRILGIGVGDEVIVQGNTYIASVMGITINGATPVFVEPDEFYNLDVKRIEEKITSRTKAMLVVHLYGQAARMDKIVELCKKYNLKLIEDCAQSHGAKYKGKMTGSFGDIGCFSFYPSKNLGAFGDAGAIVTNCFEIAEDVRVFCNYGSEKRYYNKVVGANSRLDELQAGLLRIKLKYIDEILKERTKIAQTYSERLNNKYVRLPEIHPNSTTVWHQYVIQCEYRDELMEYLKKNEIGTIIHYPIPPHLSQAYQYLGIGEGALPITEKYAKKVISLPIYNGMTIKEQMYVIDIINAFEPREE